MTLYHGREENKQKAHRCETHVATKLKINTRKGSSALGCSHNRNEHNKGHQWNSNKAEILYYCEIIIYLFMYTQRNSRYDINH